MSEKEDIAFMVGVYTGAIRELMERIEKVTKYGVSEGYKGYGLKFRPEDFISPLEREKRQIEKKITYQNLKQSFQDLKNDLCKSIAKLPPELHSEYINNTIDEFYDKNKSVFEL